MIDFATPSRSRGRRAPRGARQVSLAGFVVAAFVAFPACAEEAGTSAHTADQATQDASDRPLFSEVAREMIEEEGVEAANRELAQLMTLERDSYRLDVDGMIALTREFIDADEPEKALAVGNLAFMMDGRNPKASVALADAYMAQGVGFSAAMYYRQALSNDPDNTRAREGLVALGEELPEEREARAGEQERQREERARESVEIDMGPERDDLERFIGRYEDPEGRTWFFTETCAGSGHLAAGAEFGDVAPWGLRSESDTRFVQAFTRGDREPNTYEFELDADGEAIAAMWDSPFEDAAQRLERIGPLREGWGAQECRTEPQ